MVAWDASFTFTVMQRAKKKREKKLKYEKVAQWYKIRFQSISLCTKTKLGVQHNVRNNFHSTFIYKITLETKMLATENKLCCSVSVYQIKPHCSTLQIGFETRQDVKIFEK